MEKTLEAHLEAQVGRGLRELKALLLGVEERLQEQDAAGRRAVRRLAAAALRCDARSRTRGPGPGGDAK
ncbi:Protein of unknown function, partial [Gryllus bimaculatus]